MSLDSKYDTQPTRPPARPAERLEAYEHTCRAIAGQTSAPTALLDAKQRDALFTEKQVEALMRSR